MVDSEGGTYVSEVALTNLQRNMRYKLSSIACISADRAASGSVRKATRCNAVVAYLRWRVGSVVGMRSFQWLVGLGCVAWMVVDVNVNEMVTN